MAVSVQFLSNNSGACAAYRSACPNGVERSEGGRSSRLLCAQCDHLSHRTMPPVSKVFAASEFWEHPASKRSTTLLIWPLLSAMLQSPSLLSSTNKGYGSRRKSALSWMRLRE